MNEKINTILQETIEDLQEKISENQKQIELIQNLDLTKPITEKMWNRICGTPLRTRNTILCILILNTFPDAEEICIHSDYAYFSLIRIRCALPISSNCNKIHIDTSWYDDDDKKPILHETISEHMMREYFAAKDKKENWENLFNLRIAPCANYPKLIKFIMWFGRYRWKDDHRKGWEAKFKEDEDQYREDLEEFEKMRKDMYERTRIMVEKVIPELREFSNNIHAINTYDMSPEEIAEREGFKI